jgi:phage terminase small subunit
MAAGKKPASRKAGSSWEEATAKRLKFVEAFLVNGGNASKAAVSAGYSEKTAGSQGQRLLKHVEVVQLLNNRRTNIQQTLQLSTDEIMADMARTLRFDPRKLFNIDGSMKPIQELDDDTALCLTGIEVIETASEGGETSRVKKIKWETKSTARDQALKVFGMYEKDNKQKAGALSGLPRELIKTMIERLQALNGEYRRVD